MGKRRLTWREQTLVRKAARDGYRSFRYGSSQPVSLPRVFTGEKRRHMVSRVMDVLRDWRQSPFEHEGPARAGIRSGLCLEGHGWQRADNEAAELVAEGLHLMGAKRPTWAAGQPEYVIGRESCANCRGPLDAAAIANRDRFCCDECRTAMRTFRNERYWQAEEQTLKWAYQVAAKKAAPERACQWCGAIYRSPRPDTVTCCTEHAARLREQKAGRAIPDKICRNPACGKLFHPQNRSVEYCSTPCHREHQAAMLGTALCANPACGKPFERRYAVTKYCGGKCRRTMEKGRTLPEKACANPDCGKLFAPKKPSVAYCSRTCARRDRDRKASAFMCEEIKEVA